MQAFVQYIFDPFFAHPILNLLVVFYKLFLFIKLPGAFGFAIIALTVAVRLLFQPFFQKQMETAKKMQELKPHLDNLSTKHKNDQKQLQAEQLKLYQQHGINPTSGCLVMILQLPVFIALYNTLNLFLLNGHAEKTITAINKVLYFSFLKIDSINSWFFGLDLVKSPKQAGDWYYLLIPVITAALQYFQAQASMPPTSGDKTSEVGLSKKVGQTSEVKKTNGGGDFQKAMNTQMKYMFPLMIGWFSYSLPIGLALYWNIFSIMGIMQYKKTNSKSKMLNVK
ncbi:MAG: YidC/Oxa1 family membrane protein insertase [Candidatus Roizmanbacteria bacterium]|nr:YidC/Oxa1 family membrane protein insertase [Candidatus Roizmanbacteria bacterium]